MKIIKCLAEKIEEELNDANEYIQLALKWKDEQPEAAELFAELSGEEMGHMEKLHQEAEDLIEKERARTGEPPKEMMTLYNYLHEKHQKTAMEIRVKQGMYKMQEA